MSFYVNQNGELSYPTFTMFPIPLIVDDGYLLSSMFSIFYRSANYDIQNHFVVTTKNQIIRYLQRNKDIFSIRAISENTGFNNLHKILNGQIDSIGHAFTFPNTYVRKVAKEIKRLQALSKL